MKPNDKQQLTSFETQTVSHPADIRPAALASPLVHMLARIDGGDLVADAEEKLQKLVSNCMIFNKKGEMTITIKFAPGGLKRMELNAKVTAKIPEGEAAGTSMFCTPDGQLSAYDPDQPQFKQPTHPALDTPVARPAVEAPTARLVPLPDRPTRVIEMVEATGQDNSTADSQAAA